jgi:hypothetical protein
MVRMVMKIIRMTLPEALTLLLGNLKFFICEAKDMRTS